MPLTVDCRAATGETTGSVALDDTVFGIQPNVAVMHQVVTAQLAAARAGTHSTKTRAEVSGGGKKPFKQKGTGRARQGSERSPHFTGGGIALGPKPRSYRQKTPRKMIQLALRSALSDRAAEGRVAVVEPWPWTEPSTKEAVAALEALELEGRVLLVLSRQDEHAYKSFRNLPEVHLILAEELNTYDVLCSDWVVFTTTTLPGSNTEAAVAAPSAKNAAAEPAAAAAPAAHSAAAEPAVPSAKSADAEPADAARPEGDDPSPDEEEADDDE